MPRSHRFPTRRTLSRVSNKLYFFKLISAFFPRRGHFRFRHGHEHDVDSGRRVSGKFRDLVLPYHSSTDVHKTPTDFDVRARGAHSQKSDTYTRERIIIIFISIIA